MIKKTEFITFPRSGHHFLERTLRRYFGDEFKYCEKYTEPDKRFEVCPETNAEKNHDFGLLTPIRDDRQYVVQVRDPFEAIQSWAELEKIEKAVLPFFWKEKLEYFRGFVEKWVINDVPNRIVIHYRELADFPAETAYLVTTHITGKPGYLQDFFRLRGITKEEVRNALGVRPGNPYLTYA